MSKIAIQSDWFASWFDSPYYHKLYNNRDFNEAEVFINNLVSYLKLEQKSDVLDLACGKGRHAFSLSQHGLNVLGLDLAPNSISEANAYAHANLKFAVHDMREVYSEQTFDVVFNLFTSFGYFDNDSDNLRVLNAVHTMLNDEGRIIIDFMNSTKVINNLVTKELKQVEELSFDLERIYDGKHIYKHIKFVADNTNYHFTERVQALEQADFLNLLEKSNFKVDAIFGDYQLSEYDAKNSPRLILIATKK